jgi:Domain of unknown function (DUF4373)
VVGLARPFKQGVDYFPLDVHLDNKFKFIEIKFGLKGFAVVVKMLQNIYSQGYWAKWDEDEKLLFANENRLDFQEVEDITNESIEREIFNKDVYQRYSVLTSIGIQTRYKEIVRRRKDVKITSEYLLFDELGRVNDDINPSEGKQDDDKSTQSKVKESKVKESKVNKTKEIDTVFQHYLSKNIVNHQKITEPMKSAVRGRLKDYSLEQILKAIDNYSTVLDGDEYYFSHKYPLADLMRDKDLRKFLDESDPLNNFLKNKTQHNKKQIDWEDL